MCFFFSSRRRHTRSLCDWSSDVCSSDLFDELFLTQPAAYWVKLFSDADLLATPVNDYSDVAEDVQVLANGYITEVERSEERRVGKECRGREAPGQEYIKQ